jgi:hypothetical protein
MLTTRDFRHISLGKEGVPSVTRVFIRPECFAGIRRVKRKMCALTQKDQIHSRKPTAEAGNSHK